METEERFSKNIRWSEGERSTKFYPIVFQILVLE